VKKQIVGIVEVGVAVALFFVAIHIRAPFLPDYRVWLFWSTLLLSLSIIVFEVPRFKQRNLLAFLAVLIAGASLVSAIALETKYQLVRRSVLSADPQALTKLGQHFIIGYQSFDQVKTLVEKGAIGGIFITTRNIQGRTKEQIKQEIQALQNIRLSQNLTPLWIATDQEGGIVSRLSPPLTQLPQLSDVIADEKIIERKKDDILNYGRTQGKELSEIGINLNFAPVVDLNQGIVSPQDRFSKIYQRAISGDQNIVAKVALWYCQALEESGVKCTIKHFPGLGRVQTDTHIDAAELETPIGILIREDWVPFRKLMANSSAMVMLGHAKLMAIDPQTPTSFSEAIVTHLIRDDWQYNGILITDDFCMQAIYSSADGLENATVKAINAGVDLILIAFDGDLYYKSMNAILNADKLGKLNNSQLEKSQQRLQQQKIKS
jgi:beta-N-acetylhexosaminidase